MAQASHRATKSEFPGADSVSKAEGNTAKHVIASAWLTRRGRRTWHVSKLLAREPGGPRIANDKVSPEFNPSRRSDDARARVAEKIAIMTARNARHGDQLVPCEHVIDPGRMDRQHQDHRRSLGYPERNLISGTDLHTTPDVIDCLVNGVGSLLFLVQPRTVSGGAECRRGPSAFRLHIDLYLHAELIAAISPIEWRSWRTRKCRQPRSRRR